MFIRQIAATLAVVTATTLASAQERIPGPTPIRPDTDVQSELREIASTILEAGEENRVEVTGRISRFVASAGNDTTFLVEQLLYFVDAEVRHGDSFRGRMTFGYILENYVSLPDQDLLDIIVPFLGKGDSVFRKRLYNVLYTVDADPRKTTNGAKIDFAPYRTYLSDNPRLGEELLLPLVDYMFEHYPVGALGVMVEFSGDGVGASASVQDAKDFIVAVSGEYLRKSLLDDADVEFAQDLLEPASLSRVWWERLFVASVIKFNRDFGRDDIVTRLRSDGHPLVRKRIRELKPRDQDTSIR